MLNFFWRPSDFFINSLIDLDIDTPQIVTFFKFFYVVFCLYILYQDIKTIVMSIGINLLWLGFG